MNSDQYKLCYATNFVLWFTTAHLENQWGDDWDDAPHWLNAGPPYEWEEYRDVPRYHLYRLAYDAFAFAEEGELSVEQINKDRLPWVHGQGFTLHAGDSLPECVERLLDSGGRIYLDPTADTPACLSPLVQDGLRERDLAGSLR